MIVHDSSLNIGCFFFTLEISILIDKLRINKLTNAYNNYMIKLIK
jgi:hypothetical protein